MSDQRGFTRWINGVEMQSFSTFVGEIRLTLILVALGSVDVWMLTRHATEIAGALVSDPRYTTVERAMLVSSQVSIFLAHNTAAEAIRQGGLWLAGVLVAAILGKTAKDFFGSKNVRETSREAFDGRARVEAAKAPPLVGHARRVEQRVENVPVGEIEEEHRWRDREPTEGLG